MTSWNWMIEHLATVVESFTFSTFITVETKDGVITCPADNIIFLEIERRKATITTTSNAYEICNYSQVYDELLKVKSFYQTHRSFIVNMKYIASFTKDTVSLVSPSRQSYTAYLTKRKYTDFKKNYFFYLGSVR